MVTLQSAKGVMVALGKDVSRPDPNPVHLDQPVTLPPPPTGPPSRQAPRCPDGTSHAHRDPVKGSSPPHPHTNSSPPPGSLILFCADKPAVANAALARLRLYVDTLVWDNYTPDFPSDRKDCLMQASNVGDPPSGGGVPLEPPSDEVDPSFLIRSNLKLNHVANNIWSGKTQPPASQIRIFKNFDLLP